MSKVSHPSLECKNLADDVEVDYLFVGKGLAGLRKNFDISTRDMELALGEKAGVAERAEEDV